MNHNHESSPSPDQTEPKNSDNIVQEETNDIVDKQKDTQEIGEKTLKATSQEKATPTTDEQATENDAQKIGKKTLESIKQVSPPTPKERISTNQLADKFGIDTRDISALLKMKDYKEFGLKMGQGIYFTEKEQEKIATFFKDNLNMQQLAKRLGTSHRDINTLLSTKDYKDYGSKLGQSTFFNKEEQEKIATFFKNNTATKQLAKRIGVNAKDIGALLNIKEYKDFGLKLSLGTYFTEEEQEKIVAFFRDKTSTSQLANKIKVNRTDIHALLKTKGYEKCGIKLGQGTYLTKEEQEKIATFFRDKTSTSQLASRIKVRDDGISALLKMKGYKDYGIKLGLSNYFTEKEQERIAVFFKGRINTPQLAEKIDVPYNNIGALIKTKGYENCGIKLGHSVYFSKEGQETIASFFKNNISARQLAEKIEIPYEDIRTLLKTKDYEKYGAKLGQGTYYSKEEQEKIATFFKENISTKQLAERINIPHHSIGALLKIEDYKDCGLKLIQGIYFNEEEQKKIATFFKDKINLTQLAKEIDSSYPTIDKIVRTYNIQGVKIGNGIYYDKNQQVPEIIEIIEHESPKDSFPETAIRFYLQQAGLNVKKIKPDWMKKEETGRNLEIDMYIEFDNPPPPGIGIEYDGGKWHPNPEYDASKNDIAAKSGIEIIHIREKGCPPLRDDIPCIIRQDRKRSSLEDCIRQVFNMLHIPLPETGIDVSKKGDRAKILELSSDKEIKAKAYKGIQTNDVNRNGADISNTDAA